MRLPDKREEDAVKARFVITLSTLLALVLGGAGPAAADSSVTKGDVCAIDGGAFQEADRARLPDAVADAIYIVGGGPDGTNVDFAQTKCTNSKKDQTVIATCKKWLPGTLTVAQKVTIKTLAEPCQVSYAQCGVDLIKDAHNTTVKLRNEDSSVCLDHDISGPCYVVDVSCQANRNFP
jgi:hypothetical protein